MICNAPRISEYEKAPFRRHAHPKVRLLAYHLSWIDAGVIHAPKKTRQPPTQPLSLPPSNGSSTWLSRLPVELLHMILRHVTLQDLCSLRRTQQALNAQIVAYPPYRNLGKAVPELLGALCATRLAHVYTSEQVVDAASIDRCAGCRGFATFLFLPTLQRACAECLRHDIGFRLIPAAAAQSLFALSSTQVKALPKMLTYPGTYGFDTRRKWRRRMWLLSTRHVIDAAVGHQGLTMEEVLEQARRAYNRRGEQGQSKRLATDWAVALNFENGNDPYSGVAAIYLPFLRQSARLEQPMWCAGCERTFVWARLSSDDHSGRAKSQVMERRAYTGAGLLAHIESCPGARRLWGAFKETKHANGHEHNQTDDVES